MNRRLATVIGFLPLIGFAIHGVLLLDAESHAARQRFRSTGAAPATLAAAERVSRTNPARERSIRDPIGASTSITVARAKSASVSGQVVGADGRPIAGVPIHYYEAGARKGAEINTEPTDAEGRFVISGLSERSHYQFIFGRPAYSGNDYGFGPTTVPAPTKGPSGDFVNRMFHAVGGRRHNLGRVVVLRTITSVTGRLVTRHGSAPTGTWAVVLDGRHTFESVTMQSDGRFRFPRVVKELMTLSALREDWPLNGPMTFIGAGMPKRVVRQPVNGGDQGVIVRVR